MNLRKLVATIGVALLLGACVAALEQKTSLSLDLGLPGLVLAGGVAFERWRYKPVLRAPPTGTWRPTGERFIDVETGRTLEVFQDEAGGKRAYVTSDQSSNRKRVQ